MALQRKTWVWCQRTGGGGGCKSRVSGERNWGGGQRIGKRRDAKPTIHECGIRKPGGAGKMESEGEKRRPQGFRRSCRNREFGCGTPTIRGKLGAKTVGWGEDTLRTSAVVGLGRIRQEISVSKPPGGKRQ